MKFWKTKGQKKSKDRNLSAVFPFYVCDTGVIVLNLYRII